MIVPSIGESVWEGDPPPSDLLVLFYVNLKEVAAPWEDDWEKTDIGGKPIKAKMTESQGYRQYREDKYKAKGGIPDKSLI
jgi:hypothetical protein